MNNQSRLEDLVRFNSILKRLEDKIGGFRKLGIVQGRMAWPNRGVYFFHEQGELRSDTGRGPRVVRVGTHAPNLHCMGGQGEAAWLCIATIRRVRRGFTTSITHPFKKVRRRTHVAPLPDRRGPIQTQKKKDHDQQATARRTHQGRRGGRR